MEMVSNVQVIPFWNTCSQLTILTYVDVVSVDTVVKTDGVDNPINVLQVVKVYTLGVSFIFVYTH